LHYEKKESYVSNASLDSSLVGGWELAWDNGIFSARFNCFIDDFAKLCLHEGPKYSGVVFSVCFEEEIEILMFPMVSSSLPSSSYVLN
jgi:hypothetical protein